MRAAGRSSGPVVPLLAVAGVTLVGLALRLSSLGDSLFADEVSTYFVVNGHGPGTVLDYVRGDAEATPPLYYLLAWATQGVGDPAAGLRLPSLLAGVAAIPLTYLLGLRTVGRRAAIVGAALIALSPLLIFYSTEARAYELALLAGLLSTLAMLRALETGHLRWWVVFALCSAAAVYSHYTAVFVLVAQFAWAFLARPDARRGLLAATLGAMVLYMPWLPGFLGDRDAPGTVLIDALRPFGPRSALTDVARWAVGSPLTELQVPTVFIGADVPLSSIPGRPALTMIGAGLALAAVAAVAILLRARSDGGRSWRPSAGVALVVVLAIATPLGAAIYSLLGDSVFQPRNLIASWPGLALGAGALLGAGRGWQRVAAVTLVLGGFAVGAAKQLDADNQRPDYEAAAAFIERTGGAGDPVVEVPVPTPGPQTALEAALRPPGENPRAGRLAFALEQATLADRIHLLGPDGPGPFVPVPIQTAERVAKEAAILAEGGTLFVVRPGSQPFDSLRSDPESTIDEFLNDLPPRFRVVETRTFPGLRDVSVYVLRDGERPAGSGGQ